jgi:hypothetical protein
MQRKLKALRYFGDCVSLNWVDRLMHLETSLSEDLHQSVLDYVQIVFLSHYA